MCQYKKVLSMQSHLASFAFKIKSFPHMPIGLDAVQLELHDKSQMHVFVYVENTVPAWHQTFDIALATSTFVLYTLG